MVVATLEPMSSFVYCLFLKLYCHVDNNLRHMFHGFIDRGDISHTIYELLLINAQSIIRFLASSKAIYVTITSDILRKSK